jgi:hypothetical protein
MGNVGALPSGTLESHKAYRPNSATCVPPTSQCLWQCEGAEIASEVSFTRCVRLPRSIKPPPRPGTTSKRSSKLSITPFFGALFRDADNSVALMTMPPTLQLLACAPVCIEGHFVLKGLIKQLHTYPEHSIRRVTIHSGYSNVILRVDTPDFGAFGKAPTNARRAGAGGMPYAPRLPKSRR